MKALIYEQFNPLINIYTKFLKLYGFEVEFTKEYDVALKMLQSAHYDLVIIKYEVAYAHQQPSGYDLVKQIREVMQLSCAILVVTEQGLNRTQLNELLELKVFSVLQIPFSKGAFEVKLKDLGFEVL